MDVKDIILESLDWIHMIRDRHQWSDLVKTVAKLRDQL